MKRSPTAALWLSLCPGIGHVYLGQPRKGLVLMVAVVSTFAFADRVADGFIPVALFFWIAGAIDAYRSAQETNQLIDTGRHLPRSTTEIAVAKWWGWALITIGVLFFLENLGLFDADWFFELWPLALIGLGVYVLRRPAEPTRPASDDLPPPPVPASPDEESGSDDASVAGDDDESPASEASASNAGTPEPDPR